MDFLHSVLSDGSGSLMSDGIKAVVNYLNEQRIEPEDYSKLLKDAAKMLLALRDDNEQKIKRFQNHTRRTSRFYNEWHIRVPRIVSDLEKLQTECEKHRNLLEDCSIRSILHEKVRSYLDRVDRFLEQGKFTEEFLVDQPPEPVVMIDSVPDITKFATLKRPLEDILSLLSDEEVKTVVIWGPLGVGKTTIMQYLNNQEEVAGRFQIVIWIKLSEERTMEKLQMGIASRLNLNLQGTETDREVARRISEKLKATKYLILLDDVRGVINQDQLKDIGVPDNKLNGSKVVLTTEKLRLCCGMESISEIEVKRLTQSEALEMFKQIVTDKKFKIPGIKQHAELVAEECGGLPLMIKIVASYFKFKVCAAEWRNGLRELRKGLTAGITGLTEIHESLKCCYDDLEDEKKRCLLYTALHPADTMISSDYLVVCWAVEKLCGNIVHNGSFYSACDKGYDILGHLINVSLLQADKRMGSVTVNKVVRQVALRISSQDHAGEFLIGDETETSPASHMNNDWEQATRIFMIDVDAKLEHLPRSPTCSMLLSLLLQKNPDLKAIPPLFFETMERLLVLNLCQTGITSLPDSFKKLIGLKALFLNDCESFSTLPSQIAQLCHLEVFDIRGCKVIFIPSSIKKLGQLRCFRVSYYKPVMRNGYGGKKTHYNVISKLIKLEELVIDVLSYDQWCTEARNVIQQVASLKNLTSLKMCFPKPEDLRTLMERRQECQVCQPLSSFQFSIGSQNSHPKILDYFNHPIERYLGYNYNGHHNGSTIYNGFPTTDALDLSCNNNIPCFSDFIQAQGLNGVFGCLVEQCNNMETIINGNNAGGRDILPSLQQLHLRNLTHLKSIFAGPLSGGSLSELQTLVVKSCPKLTEISSNGLIQQLPQLLKLTVESCDDITQLIKGYGGSGSMSSLEVLELVDMKKLKNICADESLAWPKLKELRIVQCNELKELPFNKENAAWLKLIRGQQAWWNDLPNNEFKRHFQSSGILRFEAGSD
ncbi:hypothetical protein SLEP1_g12662 [Rubroshorea leprosula]|uniref:AAA+ ATPase domain-containing protein n=1 Tax=Rubroshorea leprosula TaxID=152421 RepID=A0AAV5IL81_9ROSI|nr:hypothetical protein SLEP1_g12662 [Rubroshorea leprosula]